MITFLGKPESPQVGTVQEAWEQVELAGSVAQGSTTSSCPGPAAAPQEGHTLGGPCPRAQETRGHHQVRALRGEHCHSGAGSTRAGRVVWCPCGHRPPTLQGHL